MEYYIPVARQQQEVQNPLDNYAKIMQIQGAQNQNQLAQYSLAKAQRDDAAQNALADVYKNSLDPTTGKVNQNALYQGLAARGVGYKIPDVQKQFMANEKTQADMGKVKADTDKLQAEWFSSQAGRIAAMPTDENIAEFFTSGAKRGVISQEQAMRSIQGFSALPPAMRQQKLLEGEVKAKEMLDKLMVDANTKLTTDTSRATNAATIAATMRGQDISAGTARRGQDMADARSRESISATLSKPFEVTGPDGNTILVQQDKQGNIKPVEGYSAKGVKLTEDQGKASQWYSSMRDAESILSTLPKSANESFGSVGAGIGSTIRSAPLLGGTAAAEGLANLVDPKARQQALNAQRNWINAMLRSSTGAAYKDMEVIDLERMFFPKVGDDDAVIAQKDALRRSIMEAEKMRAGPGAKLIEKLPPVGMPKQDQLRTASGKIGATQNDVVSRALAIARGER